MHCCRHRRSPDRGRTLYRRERFATGFTLFEVILVLGLIAILSGVVLPAVGRWQAGVPLQRAEAAVRDALLTSRTVAMSTGQPTGLEIESGSSRYRSLRQGPEGWSRLEHQLPDGVRFAAESGSGTRSTTLTFTPDGVATDAAIDLVAADGHQTRLRLRRLTGNVSVESIDDDTLP